MNILLISTSNDPHATAVKWGIQNLGYEANLVDISNFPDKYTSSFTIENGNTPPRIFIDDQELSTPFDVIWNRRHGSVTPPKNCHPDDVKIIRTESIAYLSNIVQHLGHDRTLWVNTFQASRYANNKSVQLRAAKSLGFQIPDTLISNNCEKIRNFLFKHHGKIIHKSFMPDGWEQEDGSVIALQTALVSEEDLLNEESIRSCPGIFQEHIEKAYELRVTVMGDSLFTCVIDSQSKGKSIDWRYDDNAKDAPIKATQLPRAIEDKCFNLCKKLNLVFGCIDLIVSLKGDYIFLEVNEAGQFLWKEAADTSLTMLDSFCKLLINGNGSTKNSLSKSKIYLEDWEASAEYMTFKKAFQNAKKSPSLTTQSTSSST